MLTTAFAWHRGNLPEINCNGISSRISPRRRALVMSVLVGSPFASTSRLAYLSWANNLIVNPDTGKRTGTAAPTLHSLRHDSTPPYPLSPRSHPFHLRSLFCSSPSPSLVSPSSRCSLASLIFFSFSFCTFLLYNSLLLGSHGQAAAESLGNALFQSVDYEVTFTLATVW